MFTEICSQITHRGSVTEIDPTETGPPPRRLLGCLCCAVRPDSLSETQALVHLSDHRSRGTLSPPQRQWGWIFPTWRHCPLSPTIVCCRWRPRTEGHWPRGRCRPPGCLSPGGPGSWRRPPSRSLTSRWASRRRSPSRRTSDSRPRWWCSEGSSYFL